MDTGDVTRARDVIESGDIAVARSEMDRAHVRATVLPDPSRPFRFAQSTTGTSLVSVRSLRLTGVLEGELDSGDDVIVVWVKSGSGQVGDRRLVPGRPTVYPAGVNRIRCAGFEKDVLRVRRSVVEAVAGERSGWAAGPLVFDPDVVISDERLAAWWVMIRMVATEVLAGPSTVSADRDAATARVAAAGILATFPHRPADPTTAKERSAARLDRAEEFMLRNARQAVTPEQVAEAAGMSVRTLQQRFRRQHGITPSEYIRRIRLHLVRDDIDAAGGSAAVGEIARRAGFAHLGRFAAAYRAEFGELPSARAAQLPLLRRP